MIFFFFRGGGGDHFPLTSKKKKLSLSLPTETRLYSTKVLASFKHNIKLSHVFAGGGGGHLPPPTSPDPPMLVLTSNPLIKLICLNHCHGVEALDLKILVYMIIINILIRVG